MNTRTTTVDILMSAVDTALYIYTHIYSYKPIKFIIFIAADVQAIDIDQEFDTYDYHSDFPISNVPYTVSLPDTPLPSECGDSVAHLAADIVDDNDLDDDLYESCTYDSYYDNSNFQPVTPNVPRIVVTPTPEDEAIRRASLTAAETIDDNRAEQNETFALLSSKLNALNRNDTELNIEQHGKLFMGDGNKFTNSPSTHSANSSDVDLSNHDAEKNCEEFDMSGSESDSESEMQSDDEIPRNERRRNDNLQAVRSVTNINVYNEEESEQSDDEQDVENFDSRHFDNNPKEKFAGHEAHSSHIELREIDEDSDENSDDIINFVIDGDHHNCGDGDEANASCDLLSVIYEEDDERSTLSKRPITVSISSSNSSSTTLAHDEQQVIDAYDENSSDDDTEEQEPEPGYSEVESDFSNDQSDDDNDDDNSTSVTVRLPLKLSFSRSSNNEEVTTVVVGNSEIEDAGLCESDSDVSVSFSLRRSVDRSGTHSNRTSRELSNYQPASFDNDASDSEVSVSLSLPMKKKTLDSPRPFLRQQTLSPIVHAKDNFEYRPWKSIDIEDPIATANVYHHSKPFKNGRSFDKCEEMPEEEDEEGTIDQTETDDKKVSVRDRIASFEVPSIKPTNDYGRPNLPNPSISRPRSPSTEPESDSDSESEYEDEEFPPNIFPPLIPVNTSIISPDKSMETEPNNCQTEDLQCDEQAKRSVREKIASFEAPAQFERPKFDMHKETMATTVTPASAEREQEQPEEYRNFDLQNKLHPTLKPLNKNSYMQQSFPDESELDEDDSGVTSDISRRISEETDDTESEFFPELRKLTRYERAATHSRLFKLLQQDCENDSEDSQKSNLPQHTIEDVNKSPIAYKPKKIIHNVSITRKMNPELVKNAETMAERRERLSLNLKQSSSIDADNISCSSSPTPCAVNEKLIDELVQSVLKQTKRRNLQNIPVDKIQAAARKALQQQQQLDEFDSCDTAFNSFDSTPALTPQEFREDSFDECDTWNSAGTDCDRKLPSTDILPSKAFKNLQEQSLYGRKRKLWAARCPRVLSSKTVNTDLGRVAESRESQSPEPSSYYSHLS